MMRLKTGKTAIMRTKKGGILDIQKQIEERKAQATRLRIFEKAVHAACYLGGGHRDRDIRCGERETHVVYSDPDASLTIDFKRTVHSDTSTYKTLEIRDGERTVFLHQGGTLVGYIPGDWETELDRLQPLADRAKETVDQVAEQKRQGSKSERAASLRKAWGLSGEDGRTRGSGDPKLKIGGWWMGGVPPTRRRR